MKFLIVILSFAALSAPYHFKKDMKMVNSVIEAPNQSLNLSTMIKKGKYQNFYQDDRSQRLLLKKQILSKILKYFRSPLQVEEVQNSNVDLLSLKVFDPSGKYQISKAYIKFRRYFGRLHKLDIIQNEDHVFLNIDIKDLDFGEHTAYLIFKLKRKNSWWGRRYVFNKIKFEKIENPLIANLKLETFDRPFVKLDSGDSIGNISKYIYRTYRDGKLIESTETTESSLFVVFKEVGNYKMQVEIFDESRSALSNFVSYETTQTAPTLKYKVTKSEEFFEHYEVDFTETTDADGDDIAYYRVTLFDKDEVIFDEFTDSIKYSFNLPKINTEFDLRLRAYDQTNTFDEDRTTLVSADKISPKILGYYISEESTNPTIRYIGVEARDDGEIASYHYTATHEDGEVIEADGGIFVKDNLFFLPKKGNWTFDFYVIDDQGLKSDTVSKIREVTWDENSLIPRYLGHYFSVSEDPRIYYIGSGFEDVLGEVVAYNYKATHESGLVTTGVRGSELDNELRFKLKGSWSIEITATDNDGNVSEPFIFNENITWDFDRPLANVTIVQDPNDPLRFEITQNNSYPNSIVTSKISAVNNSNNETFNYSQSGAYLSFNLPSAGEWIVNYSFVDLLDMESTTQSFNFSIEIIDSSGDIIPPDPGDRGLASLEGIDSDNDGIRDDLENLIYNEGVSINEKNQLLKFVKVAQDQMPIVNDPTLSNEMIRKMNDLDYCLEYTFGEERADEISTNLKIQLYNTKERIRAFAQTQINFAGEVVTLDTDRDNYFKYCEDN